MKTRLLCPLLVVLLGGTVLLAAPPELVIPSEIKAEVGDWVDVTPKTNAKNVVYVGLDGLKAFPSHKLKDPRDLVVNVPESGRGKRFRFVAVGTLNDEMTQAPFVIAVAGESKPDPNPGPGPNPPKPDPPKPQPIAKAWVVVIEETASAAVNRAQFFNDEALAAYVKSKGWQIRTASKDVKDVNQQTPADLKPYVDWSKDKAKPWLFVVDQVGTVRHNDKLPETPAELLDLLKKIGGA